MRTRSRSASTTTVLPANRSHPCTRCTGPRNLQYITVLTILSLLLLDECIDRGFVRERREDRRSYLDRSLIDCHEPGGYPRSRLEGVQETQRSRAGDALWADCRCYRKDHYGQRKELSRSIPEHV